MLMTNEEHQGFGSGLFTTVLAVGHWVFGVSLWGWSGLAMVIGTRKGLPSFPEAPSPKDMPCDWWDPERECKLRSVKTGIHNRDVRSNNDSLTSAHL